MRRYYHRPVSKGHAPYSQGVMREAIIKGSILASFTCEAFSTKALEGLSEAAIDERLENFRALTAY